MVAEQVTRFPAAPGEVAEWEDLLLRLEIVPRVVRNSVEETADVEAAATVLREALARERAVNGRIERAAGLDARNDPALDPPADATTLDLAVRFASHRARTFAMVQRRGLEVWDWRTPLEGGKEATVHQLLLWLAGRDGELLAELRRASRSAPAGC